MAPLSRLPVLALSLLVALLTISVDALAYELATPEVYGDFRLRYEENSATNVIPSWSRGVVRGRIGASFAVNGRFELGGRIVTGDPDNPRTSDVTLSDLNGNFEISLDRLYATFEHDRWQIRGGKFANPFASTEVVWDSDVNPQGLAATYTYPLGRNFVVDFSALYFLIDDELTGDDNLMRGAQFSARWKAHDVWTVEIHGSYYDYDLNEFSPNSQALTRGNALSPDGVSLLSDFDLVDAVASVTWSGLHERWPIRIIANRIANKGAAIAQDGGHSIDLFVGRLDHSGNVRLRYGYSEAERDAVLGVFTQDNIILATNYQLHTFSIDYSVFENTFVGLTHYEFRSLENIDGAAYQDHWATRTRLNLWFQF